MVPRCKLLLLSFSRMGTAWWLPNSQLLSLLCWCSAQVHTGTRLTHGVLGFCVVVVSRRLPPRQVSGMVPGGKGVPMLSCWCLWPCSLGLFASSCGRVLICKWHVPRLQVDARVEAFLAAFREK